MKNKILIAYATKYGATAEIAEKIKSELQLAGHEVTVQPANQVTDLSQYSAILLGSALYMGQWRKEAADFLKNNQSKLAERAFWIFTSGPTGPGDPKELVKNQLVPESLKTIVEACKPKEIAVFGGILSSEKMNFFEKWIIKKVNAPSGDFRDWQAISAWTSKINDALIA